MIFNQDNSDLVTGINNNQSALAIVISGNTNNSGSTIAKGFYIYLKGHSSLSEGLYIASQSIPSGTTITASYVTSVSGGGLNNLPKTYEVTDITMPSAVGSKVVNLAQHGVAVPTGWKAVILLFMVQHTNASWYQVPMGAMDYNITGLPAFVLMRTDTDIDIRLCNSGETNFGGQPTKISIMVVKK